MNFLWTRAATLVSLVGLVATSVVISAPSPVWAQTDSAVSDNALNAFVGTWTARAPGEGSPYLVLKFQEHEGKLTGTTTHFKMKVIGKGEVIGSAEATAESLLGDLTVGGAELFFAWNGDSRFQGLGAKFTLQGTRQASMIFGLPRKSSSRS